MFDAPVDTWYLWIGVAAASAVAVGIVTSLPTAPAPNADGAAATIESVATSEYEAVGRHPLDADAIELGPRRIALRTDAGTANAVLSAGPVTPVADDTPLRRVLRGQPPERVFESPADLRETAATARNRTRGWRPTDGPLVVRRVTWEGVDVTLVGA